VAPDLQPVAKQTYRRSRRHVRGDFLERLFRGLLEAMELSAHAERLATRAGFLQGLDPRFKTLGLLSLVLTAVLVRSLISLAGLFGFAILLASGSHLGIVGLARRVWMPVLLFTGMIAAPALFLVPGDTFATVPFLDWTITRQGARSAAFLIGRAETTASFASLLVLTTPWQHVLKALGSLRVPLVVIVILGMTHRYILVLLGTAVSMLEAQRSRLMGPLSGRERRRLAAASTVILLDKALHLSTEVHLAMIARGYRGEVHLLDDFRPRPSDWIVLAGFLAVAAAALVQR
jgi:cobalt/nickel transport system permease protein